MSNASAVVGLGLFLFLRLFPPTYAELANGSFLENLAGWKAAWPVEVRAGEAVLDDRQTPHVFLFQAVRADAGFVSITFDFQSTLSDQAAPNAFRDSFYASLYEVANPSDFITEHDKFIASHGLMDMDASGPFDVQGTVSATPGRAGWSRFTGTVPVTQPYVVVVFELYDLNFVVGDSAVHVDNVSVLPGAAP